MRPFKMLLARKMIGLCFYNMEWKLSRRAHGDGLLYLKLLDFHVGTNLRYDDSSSEVYIFLNI